MQTIYTVRPSGQPNGYIEFATYDKAWGFDECRALAARDGMPRGLYRVLPDSPQYNIASMTLGANNTGMRADAVRVS